MTPEQLRSLILFEQMSEQQLDWLAQNSSEIMVEDGTRLTIEGQPGHSLFVLIEGEWRLTRLVNGYELTLTTSDYAGSWIGSIPLVDGLYQTTSQVLRPSRFLQISNQSVGYMLNNGFPISSHIISGISAGARNAEAIMRQHEKMAALGKLSAGLAHELNNPAAAEKRAAGQLRETLRLIQLTSLKVNQSLTPAQVGQLAVFQQELRERAKTAPQLDTLVQSEKEDELSAWLEDHQVEQAWQVASGLVEAGVDRAWLDRLAEATGDALPDALTWLDSNLTAGQLLDQIENSAERISTLVKAVKEYSYMDQAPRQEIDVHEGLESTLTMLNHKLKHGITVTREYDRSLPRLNAFGSELNQVWTNLLDNAIDALGGQGHIWLRTRRDHDNIIVEIADNGPGIPAEIQTRIFEPFFTTKEVGKGTGLGLDIAYRIVVSQHKGQLKLTSRPGDTRFEVSLPLGVA